MSLLDKNIDKQIDNILIVNKQFDILNCLKNRIAHGVFSVLIKANTYIMRLDKPHAYFPTHDLIPAYQVDYAVYYVDGIAFSYIDLIFNEGVCKWIITPRDLKKPIHMIFDEHTLDSNGKIPNILTFAPGTKIFIHFKGRGIDVFKNEPERYEIVNPYSEEKYWIPVSYEPIR